MKKSTLGVCLLTLCALLGGSLAYADDHGRGREDEYRHGHHRHGRGWDDGRDGRDFDRRDGRWYEHREVYNARGPEFYPGGYIIREYRSPVYEVDYRVHRLRRPPEGHRWVQVGPDYVLIAIATGVIASIILSQ